MNEAEGDRVALFPLHTNLAPGDYLSLQIFEPRYLSLVSRCMQEQSCFATCLIRQGHEVGPVDAIYPVATLARIIDFDQLENGLLGIKILGERRFLTDTTRVEQDGLMTGMIRSWVAEDQWVSP